MVNKKNLLYFYFSSIFYLIICFNYIICKEKRELEHKIKIPVIYNIDVQNIYPTIVSFTSIMERSKKSSEYIFYLLTDIKNNNNNRIQNIFTDSCNKYGNCKINYIDLCNLKEKYNLGDIELDSSYYVLFLSEYLSNEEKVIYLHGDTIAIEDLDELISIGMEDYHYMGFLDFNIDGLEYLNIHTNNYINEGVMLINIKVIKEKQLINSYLSFIKENYGNIKNNAETIINAVSILNIGILPPRFGWLCRDIKTMNKLFSNTKNNYNQEEFEDAYGEPALLHYCGEPKPWINTNRDKSLEWWYFVNKTELRNEIIEKYGNPKYNIRSVRGSINKYTIIVIIISSASFIIFYIVSKLKKIRE